MRQFFVLLLLVLVSATTAFLARHSPRLIAPSLTMGLHDYSLTSLDGKDVPFSSYKGKVVLLENVATLWGTTVVDFNSMNDIAKSTAGCAVVGVFCNQFGHQTNENDDDILNTLKHVRPGNGFEFAGDLYAKVAVNGAAAHPLFKEIRNTIKIPMDPSGDNKGNGCDDVDALILPRGGFDSTTVATWSPVTRNDIAWNFEKFLFDKDGKLVKRYSRFYPTAAIKADIDALL